MFRIAVPLILVLALGAPAPAGACPNSELVVSGSPPFVTESAEYDSSVVREGAVVARAAYDLVEASLAVFNPGSLGGTSVLARDVFELTGVAPGTVVPVRVQFIVDGAISTAGCGGSGCWGNVDAEIRSGSDVVQQQASFNMYAADRRTFQLVVEMPRVLVAGEPIDIAFFLRGWRPPGGSHTSEGTGTYRFLDLPPGAGIASCHGYTGLPSPARPASWGRVKAAYR